VFETLGFCCVIFVVLCAVAALSHCHIAYARMYAVVGVVSPHHSLTCLALTQLIRNCAIY